MEFEAEAKGFQGVEGDVMWLLPTFNMRAFRPLLAWNPVINVYVVLLDSALFAPRIIQHVLTMTAVE